MVSLSNHGLGLVNSSNSMTYAALRQAQDERIRWLIVRDVPCGQMSKRRRVPA